MSSERPDPGLILGEYRRVYDDRYRIALPPELVQAIGSDGADCVLAKEREGALSLWKASTWRQRAGKWLEALDAKLKSDAIDRNDYPRLQTLGRILSTHHRPVALGQRGRLLVPEGFREFLGVEPGHEVMIVGAAVCIEIWQPERWFEHVRANVGDFQTLLEEII